MASRLLPERHNTGSHSGVIEWAGVVWSDWGPPERIVETFQSMGENTCLSDRNFPKACRVPASLYFQR